MPNVPWTGMASSDAAPQLIAALPFPVFVVDARVPKWPIVLTNPAFADLVEGDDAVAGRPLADVLEPIGVTAGGDHALDELLTAVAGGVAPVTSRRVEVAGRAAGEQVVPSRCWLSATPLYEDDTVWGILGTLLDDVGEGLGGPRRLRRDVLRTMATDLVADRPLTNILDDAALAAAETAGARRCAIMTSDGSSEFTVVASHGDGSLPASFDVASTAEALIDVAWGRTALVWSTDDGETTPAADALPFIGTPGWDRALVVGMRIRGGGFGLLAVGDPEESQWDDGALERLDFAGVLVGAAIESAQLRGQFSRLEELLRGAVSASAGLAGRMEPSEIRASIVRAIVEDMHLAGAALWVSDDDAGGDAVLVASAGLPEHVVDAVAVLPPDDAIAETAAGLHRWRIPTAATAARAWPGRHLHLVPVPEPAPGALGIYSTEPLPGPAQEIFSTLAQALALAVHETTLHRRARAVIEALQRQLQPRWLELPPGFDVAHVYESATAGVPLGGDFLDLFRTAAGHIGIACGDVSGKGIEAATMSAMAVHSLRAFALQGALPRIVAAMMDAAVEAQTGDDRFLTMVYGRVDPREWSVELAVAGHPAPILVGPDRVEILDVPVDVPVGMMGTSSYHQTTFSIPVGHSLVLYTDGVTEARTADEARTLFGVERLVALLGTLQHGDARTLAEGVWNGVQEWSSGETTDDCAVLVLRREPTAAR